MEPPRIALINKIANSLRRNTCAVQASSPTLRRTLGWIAVATILIVDDDIAVQATIRLLLERAGHNVVVAGDGHKALTIFQASHFDLLLLDLLMPEIDGLETMRLIRKQDPLIPIIVISGRPVISTPEAGPDILAM